MVKRSKLPTILGTHLMTLLVETSLGSNPHPQKGVIKITWPAVAQPADALQSTGVWFFFSLFVFFLPPRDPVGATVTKLRALLRGHVSPCSGIPIGCVWGSGLVRAMTLWSVYKRTTLVVLDQT